MLIKIDRDQASDKFPILPLRYFNEKTEEENVRAANIFASYVLTLPSKTYKGNQKLLGTQLTSLVKNLGYDHLIFLGDIDIAWLKRLDTHDIFRESLHYFVDNGIDRRFKGALQVDTVELPTFIKHLTWLIRTNGLLPYVHFTDPGQNMVGTICQYGNLHISTKNKTSDKRFNDIISKSKFSFLTGTACINKL